MMKTASEWIQDLDVDWVDKIEAIQADADKIEAIQADALESAAGVIASSMDEVAASQGLTAAFQALSHRIRNLIPKETK
jgi:hypothetical protein